MIVGRELSGKLGNIILECVTAFHYCKCAKIPFENLKFFPTGDFRFRYKEFPIEIKREEKILKNVINKFDCESDYSNLKKVPYKLRFYNKYTEDICFTGYTWTEHMEEIDPQLLLDLFYIKDLVREVYKDYEYYNNDKNLIGFHVRRGDFLKLCPQKVITKEEYNSTIKNSDKNNKFIVFSDDIEWCKKSLEKENYNKTEFHSSKNTECGWYDMIALSLINKIIPGLKGSTFSKVARSFSISRQELIPNLKDWLK